MATIKPSIFSGKCGGNAIALTFGGYHQGNTWCPIWEARDVDGNFLGITMAFAIEGWRPERCDRVGDKIYIIVPERIGKMPLEEERRHPLRAVVDVTPPCSEDLMSTMALGLDMLIRYRARLAAEGRHLTGVVDEEVLLRYLFKFTQASDEPSWGDVVRALHAAGFIQTSNTYRRTWRMK